jgi:hypothetical protein
VILIEDKASGTQLIQELREAGVSAVTRYKPEGNKIMRLNAQTLLCDMRHGTEFPQLHHKVRCVEALVATNRNASRRPILAGHARDHLQRRIPLGVTGGAGEFGIDHKAAAVLHENVADEAQLRALSWAFAVEPCVRIGRRGVCLVRALLAVELTSALRPSVAGRSSGSLFESSCGGSSALKLFIEAQASMRVPSIEKCSVDKSRFTLGRSSTAHKKPAATSPSRSRSRFLEKVE